MATPATEILDESLLKTLECPICTEIYDCPKQLNCGHTYCNQCIESLANQSRQNPPLFGLGGNPFAGTRNPQSTTILCPECRSPTRIPPNGLPPNYRLLEYTDRYRSLLNDYMRCVCAQWCKMENIFYCETCHTEENGSEKVLLCGTCALTNHSMHAHSVHKFEGVPKEAKKAAADKVKFAGDQIKLKLDDVLRKGERMKENFIRIYEALIHHYYSFCQVSDEILKRQTLNQIELDSKLAVSEKKLSIWNDIFLQVDKMEGDIVDHVLKFLNASVHRLTTLDEVEIPTEEDRNCDVSSTGRDAEINLNNLVINEGHEQTENSASKASVFTYKPESSKHNKHRRINSSIRKKFSAAPLSTSTISSTLPCISRSVSSAAFSVPMQNNSSNAVARTPSPRNSTNPTFPPSPDRDIPCDTDEQTSDASL